MNAHLPHPKSPRFVAFPPRHGFVGTWVGGPHGRVQHTTGRELRFLPSRTWVRRLAMLNGEKAMLVSAFFVAEKAW